jgi:hypothetical protein
LLHITAFLFQLSLLFLLLQSFFFLSLPLQASSAFPSTATIRPFFWLPFNQLLSFAVQPTVSVSPSPALPFTPSPALPFILSPVSASPLPGVVPPTVFAASVPLQAGASASPQTASILVLSAG